MPDAQDRIVAVIGSLNIDIVTVVPRLAEPGETMTAMSITTGFGGKGANQAVAAARLGGKGVKTFMVGNVGDDNFGRDYKRQLETEGIDHSGVHVCEGETTGTAVVTVETSGENRIYLAPAANSARAEEEFDHVPAGTTVAVFQLEIPFEKVLRNIKLASQQGAYVVVNPAPARALPDDVFQYIDCIILNETEAEIMSDPEVSWNDSFFAKGVRDLVILTLGSKGVQWASKQDRTPSHVPARKVKVVDTTAAGDTFVGALAARIAKYGAAQAHVRGHVEFANLAASLTVQKPGAIPSIPKLSDIEAEVAA